MDLNLTWYFLLGVLLIGYAILDGFDLGVGALHLFSKGDLERRTLLNSIGPVWDGNEVWLVTAGGALFAAFPHAYATAFSGFYIPFMVLLFALIFRAVAIEFRSKEQMTWWREMWDISFSLASIVASVLFGVAVGNLIVGLPIGPDMEYEGTLFDLLNPYSLVVGVFNLSLFMMHGSIYLYLKTDGDLQQKVKGWIYNTFFFFVAMYLITTVYTLTVYTDMIEKFSTIKWAWVIAVLNALAIANIPRALHLNLPFRAFISSCCTIAALIFLFGIGVFPNMIRSSVDPTYSLDAYNAASSHETLRIMFIIACLGLPFVLTYTVSIYWVFRGKVQIDKFSY